jgi:hypothetical protein
MFSGNNQTITFFFRFFYVKAFIIEMHSYCLLKIKTKVKIKKH